MVKNCWRHLKTTSLLGAGLLVAAPVFLSGYLLWQSHQQMALTPVAPQFFFAAPSVSATDSPRSIHIITDSRGTGFLSQTTLGQWPPLSALAQLALLRSVRQRADAPQTKALWQHYYDWPTSGLAGPAATTIAGKIAAALGGHVKVEVDVRGKESLATPIAFRSPSDVLVVNLGLQEYYHYDIATIRRRAQAFLASLPKHALPQRLYWLGVSPALAAVTLSDWQNWLWSFTPWRSLGLTRGIWYEPPSASDLDRLQQVNGTLAEVLDTFASQHPGLVKVAFIPALPLAQLLDPLNFAADGFHLSRAGHQVWVQHASAHLVATQVSFAP